MPEDEVEASTQAHRVQEKFSSQLLHSVNFEDFLCRTHHLFPAKNFFLMDLFHSAYNNL